MIPVTKTYLPPIEEYKKYLDSMWASRWVTNQGPLVSRLEAKLEEYLDLENLQMVGICTIAIQLAMKALEVKGDVITTPFSYVATTSSVIWENCTPIFVDIDPKTLCISPELIEDKITERTSAILATHVFGIPCDVEMIEKIALKHQLKVIYDGAHAFGVKYRNKPLLSYGDISTLSCHATKLFHTVEGGAVVTSSMELKEKVFLMKSFGHRNDQYFLPGINGKTSELNAAMGLSLLPHIEMLIAERKKRVELYVHNLKNTSIEFVQVPKNVEYNYAYCPIKFASEADLLKVFGGLEKEQIFPRRYFYPSLNELNYIQQTQKCPVSEDVSRRIACLPLYHDLELEEVVEICRIVQTVI